MHDYICDLFDFLFCFSFNCLNGLGTLHDFSSKIKNKKMSNSAYILTKNNLLEGIFTYMTEADKEKFD